jgi:hypothetical protein
MAKPMDLRNICSALEHFYLPAALCDIENNPSCGGVGRFLS